MLGPRTAGKLPQRTKGPRCGPLQNRGPGSRRPGRAGWGYPVGDGGRVPVLLFADTPAANKAECREQNVEPAYQKQRHGFSFIFNRQSVVNNAVNSVVNHDINDDVNDLSADDEIILKPVEIDSRVSAAFIANKIGKSVRTVQRAMSSLKERGYIERIGGTRGYWQLRRRRPV